MSYSISANSMFNIDENGVQSLEVSYRDSDGTDIGAYAEGHSFDEVLSDILDQIDEGIASQDDAKADAEEVQNNVDQIKYLKEQIEALEKRNLELQNRNNKEYEKNKEKLLKNNDSFGLFDNFFKTLEKNYTPFDKDLLW